MPLAHVTPATRVRRRTPRPVSIRYGVYKKVLYLSVRDRFGSFRRDKLLHYLTRCTTEEVQIERKKLGAGLGLYLVASSVSRMVINVLPGGLTEVICVFEPPNQTPGMKVFSFTTQRPPKPDKKEPEEAKEPEKAKEPEEAKEPTD